MEPCETPHSTLCLLEWKCDNEISSTQVGFKPLDNQAKQASFLAFREESHDLLCRMQSIRTEVLTYEHYEYYILSQCDT